MTIKVTYNVTDVYMTQSVSPVYINVSYTTGGGGGAAVWGSITGTLSNQTDLQSALDAKLDESTIDGGAEGQILSKASATDFDFAWINNYAKYLATNVRNQSGSTIAAFQVVYISGATGNKPLISLADADTEATSSKTYGVTATSIANNGTGDVVTVGELSGIDTSAFTEGDSLWLSTTAGGVVTTPPAEPAHSVFIGTVIRSHPTLGVIDVAIQNGYELNELHGVLISSAANNQGLFYNSANGLWVNKSIATALGYTPANAATTLTINGVTYDLSANRSWTISAGISGTIASGQVAYGTAADTIGGSNNLFWDNTNGRLGIGTNVPSTTLFVSGIIGTSNRVRISAGRQYDLIGASTYLDLFDGSSGKSIIRFFASTNISIGTTTDDGVNRLQVSGNALIKGSGNTSATTALTVQNSDTTNAFRVRNDGAVLLGAALTYTNVGSRAIFTTADEMRFSRTAAATDTAGSKDFFQMLTSFSPTSGNAQYNFFNINTTVNQTGGANGITRGLYVAPNLVSAADWRSIEWSNNSGWGLYGAGTANNYLAGSLGIGTTSLAVYNFRVRKNMSNASAYYGISSEGEIQSTVTSNARYFNSSAKVATSAAIPSIYHFLATQETFNGTATSQFGFFAESTLIGATNNYGYYGNIASGTGRWNLYMNGTAINYLNGALLLGTATDDGVNKLQVSGNIKASQYRLSALNTAPASASATGTLGEIRIDADHIYVCTATNTWKRVVIATF